ncbi:unnamed protein product [Ascophyllum nodosum]
MIVTVEPPLRLVLGAFVEEGKMKGGAEGVREWGYWEGEFGAQELAAHRRSLGWEGHTLESLRDCFVAAIRETQPRETHPLATAEKNASFSAHAPLPASAVNSTHTRGDSPLGLQQRSSDSAPPKSSKAAADDDPQQRAPELSESVEPGRASTVDLHYADPDIIGSWGVKLVQGGLNEGLVSSMLRCMTAAASPRRLTEDVEPASPTRNAPPLPPRGKRRGGPLGFPKHPRQRGPATGARLVGASRSSTSSS